MFCSHELFTWKVHPEKFYAVIHKTLLTATYKMILQRYPFYKRKFPLLIPFSSQKRYQNDRKNPALFYLGAGLFFVIFSYYDFSSKLAVMRPKI